MHTWLANADPETAWAHVAWPDFPAATKVPQPLVIVPLHGFVDRGPEMPLDAEELLASRVLRSAVERVKALAPIRVLPPVRHVLAAQADGVFGLDPDTVSDQLLGICHGIRESGCTKVLFLNSSSVSASLAASIALDARSKFGLNTYVIQAGDLGMSFSTFDDPTAKSASLLAELLVEILAHRAAATSPLPPVAAGPYPGHVSDFFPAVYRKRYLGGMTRARIAACASEPQALAVLPLSSIEQHGRHLPVGVDAILGQALLSEALSGLPTEAPIYVAPPLTYGKCNEHKGFPGTLTLDARTLRQSLLAVASQIARFGFKRLAVFNTHGGNTHVLATALREMTEMYGIDAFRLRASYQPGLDPQESAWGMHADEWETSLMLACAPECVRMEKAVREYPALLDDPGLLRPEKAPAIFAWLTKDLSASGVLGDPTHATAEKGRQWMSEAGAALRDRLVGVPGLR